MRNDYGEEFKRGYVAGLRDAEDILRRVMARTPIAAMMSEGGEGHDTDSEEIPNASGPTGSAEAG